MWKHTAVSEHTYSRQAVKASYSALPRGPRIACLSGREDTLGRDERMNEAQALMHHLFPRAMWAAHATREDKASAGLATGRC